MPVTCSRAPQPLNYKEHMVFHSYPVLGILLQQQKTDQGIGSHSAMANTLTGYEKYRWTYYILGAGDCGCCCLWIFQGTRVSKPRMTCVLS